MWKYIAKRLLLCLLILFGVSVIVYTLVRLMPTDYIDQRYSAQLAQGQVKQADIDRIKKLYGLYMPDARVTLSFDKELKDTLKKTSFEVGYTTTTWNELTEKEVRDENWFSGEDLGESSTLTYKSAEYTNGDYAIELRYYVDGSLKPAVYEAKEYFRVYSTPDGWEIYTDEGGAFVIFESETDKALYKVYLAQYAKYYGKDIALGLRLDEGSKEIYVIYQNENIYLESEVLAERPYLTPAKKKNITGFNTGTFFEDTTRYPNVLSKGTFAVNQDGDNYTVVFTDSEGNEFKTSEVKMYMLNGFQKLGCILGGYFTWLGNLAKGDLGMSFKYEMPVVEVIKQNMMISFIVSLVALIFQFAISIPLGIASATHQYGPLDYTVTVLAMIGIALPSFFLGRLMIALFSVKLGWLPPGGFGTANMTFDTQWAVFCDKIKYLIMPIFVLVILSIGGLMRHTRTNMLEVLNADYIRTARAKGLSEKTVVYKHAFKNTMIPLVTMLAGTLPSLFGGAMITEQVFDLPGIGNKAYQALIAGDVPFIMGYNMFLAILSVVGILASDLAYMLVDPRVKINK